MKQFSIGHLARKTGTKVQTIRYYEQIGLMPEPARNAGNQRVYDEADLQRLGFIRHARELGFHLDAIRSLLALTDEPDRSCSEADDIARAHLEEIESRILRLEALRDEMKRMILQCRGEKVVDCRILETLSDHQLCLHEIHAN